MIFIIAVALMSIITAIKRDRGSIIGLCLWIVTITIWVLLDYPQFEYLIIGIGTVWTALLLAWTIMINRQKERD